MSLIKVNGAVPLYVQVEQLLVDQIVSGKWLPSELIPSEVQLAEEFNVSQGTIRKAITLMVEKKILIRHHGKGTFVANHNNERALFQFFHIYNERDQKVLPDSTTLSCQSVLATDFQRTKLGLPKGANIVLIERIRMLDDRPVLIESIALPDKRFSKLTEMAVADLPNTLYELYETEFGVTVHGAEEKLRAVAALQSDAKALDLQEGAPLLEIERVALGLDNSPIELRISRCSTSNHHYKSILY